MSDREALLAAIRSAPDDDLPRLVYADWLEENADALPPMERDSASDRAALIRAQVEAARAEPFSPAAREANDRADRLFTEANREAWTWHLDGKLINCSFERGFIEHAAVDVEKFPDHAETLFGSEPIRSLRAVRWSPYHSPQEISLTPFFEAPQLRQITTLDLQNSQLSYSDCEKMADSPHLAGVVHLSFRGNPIFPPWLGGFLEGGCCPNLSGLDLSGITNLGPALAHAFRHADHRRFTRLDLSGIRFRSEDLKRALAGLCVSEVEELRLGWDGIGTPGSLTHLELGWVIPWERLRLLDLEGQGVGSEGVREIARHEQAANLRWLGLARNNLGRSGVRELTEASTLKLYYLDVQQNDLGPKDVLALQVRFPEVRLIT